MKPKLLDLFCGAGGASMGYYRAGFEVEGVDIKSQPHYPFKFYHADALEFPLEGYDAYHASPPCQRFSHCTPPEFRWSHDDLISPIRRRLHDTFKPFVIENVPGARFHLDEPVRLCGTMFGLKIYRHRYFEIRRFELPLLQQSCCHFPKPVLITGTHRRKSGRFEYGVQECRDASGIPWMTRKELDQAIPPAYTEYIGKYLMEAVLASRG